MLQLVLRYLGDWFEQIDGSELIHKPHFFGNRAGMKTKGPYSSRIMLERYNYNIIVSVAIYRHQTISVTVQDQASIAVICIATVLLYTRHLL